MGHKNIKGIQSTMTITIHTNSNNLSLFTNSRSSPVWSSDEKDTERVDGVGIVESLSTFKKYVNI